VKYLFLDESGNHGLIRIDPQYPVFVLGGVVVSSPADLREIDRAVAAFKERWLGRRDAVLHLADLTRSRHGWEPLSSADVRSSFYRDLESLMAGLPFKALACVVDKRAHVARYREAASDPYVLSLGVLLERFAFEIGSRERGRVIVEQRGQPLDREIHAAWRYFTERGTGYVSARVLRERVASLRLRPKREGLAGLQVADVVVGAIGRHYAGLTPWFAYEVVEKKLRTGPGGGYLGAGLVVLPKR